MKTLSKVRFSRDYFVNSHENGNDDFRIAKLNRQIKIAKQNARFSHSQKEASEIITRLEDFRKTSLYGGKPYYFKSKGTEKNFILNNFSSTHKKQAQKLLSSIAFEQRKKARQKKAFNKLFE